MFHFDFATGVYLTTESFTVVICGHYMSVSLVIIKKEFFLCSKAYSIFDKSTIKYIAIRFEVFEFQCPPLPINYTGFSLLLVELYLYLPLTDENSISP